MTAAFDPARWLHEFESTGGTISLIYANHLCVTRHLASMTAEQLKRSWALQMELSDDQSKLAAVWALMQQQRAA